MTTARHRKGKNNHKRVENNFINEDLDPELGSGNHYIPMLILLLMLLLGGIAAAWFCYEQQQTITQLTENLTGVQRNILHFQTFHEEMRKKNVELPIPEGFEERLHALEGAYAQAQTQVGMALSAAEQMKTSDLRAQMVSLHTEMMVRLSELELSTVSTEELNSLQNIVEGKSEEFQALKKNLSEMGSANTALAESVEGLSASLASAETKVGEQAALVDTLTSQLEGQFTELLGLKEALALHKAQLETSALDIATVKEVLEAEQTKRSQKLGEQLSFVRRILEEQNRDSLSLHSSLRAQLEAIQDQVENADELFPPNLETAPVEQPEELTSSVLDDVHVELGGQEEEGEQEVQEELLGQEAEDQEEQAEQEAQGEENSKKSSHLNKNRKRLFQKTQSATASRSVEQTNKYNFIECETTRKALPQAKKLESV
ncbi:hypothetical protein AAFF_G00033460 [Aldrovandia affinis]|uniref:Uncharacterized protein n=1 Tax=Aldrovandia affinis TaxID=143900 RepID=A0AAD7S5W8_9TELE|nr:hypothetical protein AAFF_G00033460 [Aldrovandia affinis]